MFALTMMPITPRVARAEGPIIDADVQRLMDEKPDEEHALIVSVELCRTPLNLEELLPTPEETNECTRLWRAWEMLAEEFEEGCNENLTKERVDAVYAEAKAYDEVIVSIQKAAYRAYHEEYAKIVEESVPDVYESLRSVLGDKVRRVSDSSKLLAVRANRPAFETLRATASIKRVSFDIPMGPMLDNSRVNIKADQVHCPNSGTAYTGAGVKVAIVDDGVVYAHPRLPTADSGDERDFSTDIEGCKFPGNTCSFSGHGTEVPGSYSVSLTTIPVEQAAMNLSGSHTKQPWLMLNWHTAEVVHPVDPATRIAPQVTASSETTRLKRGVGLCLRSNGRSLAISQTLDHKLKLSTTVVGR